MLPWSRIKSLKSLPDNPEYTEDTDASKESAASRVCAGGWAGRGGYADGSSMLRVRPPTATLVGAQVLL